MTRRADQKTSRVLFYPANDEKTENTHAVYSRENDREHHDETLSAAGDSTTTAAATPHNAT